jgi:peptidyl-prolyl cis-trans isomerase SurA
MRWPQWVTRFLRYALFFTISCVVAMLLTFALPAHAETAAMTIYGEPITEDDIEQRTRLNFVASYKQPARQDVLYELSDERDTIKRGQNLGVDPTSAEVDRAFVQMCSRMHIAPEQLTKSLESRGIRPDTLKQRIRADMVRSLVRLRH